MCDPGDRSREVPVDPSVLEAIAEGSTWLDLVPESDDAAQLEKAALRREAIAILTLIIETRLTRSQREIVDLYFYRGKTQSEIAAILGISQQVVTVCFVGTDSLPGSRVRAFGKLLHADAISDRTNADTQIATDTFLVDDLEAPFAVYGMRNRLMRCVLANHVTAATLDAKILIDNGFFDIV